MSDKLQQVIEEKEKPIEEGSLAKYWKVSCAVVYLAICIFDFIIMPAVVTRYSEELDYNRVYEQIAQIESPQAQVALINKINYNVQTWEPITLLSGGMFHIAFGAILTGVALSKNGREKSKITHI